MAISDIAINAASFIGLQLMRVAIFGITIPFAVVGFIVFLPNREFRENFFSSGDHHG